jgi:hypothetical protein
MSVVADALQPLMVKDILAVSGHLSAASIPDAILSPKAAYDLDFNSANNEIIFDFRDTSLIVSSTAADCCRLSSAAFQTAVSITESDLDKSALPWAFIKLYYSAFYSGHTIIRLLGDSCSFFDGRHVARIDSFASATGKTPSFKIDAGLYRCSIDPSATKLICVRLSGGTHEAFWNIFGQLISATTASILRAPVRPADAQLVFAQFEAFSRLAVRHGAHRWLSSLRNDLQYRHLYDVWFPSRIGKRDLGALNRLIARWRADPMDIDLDAARFGLLGEFATACAFIIAVCRILLLRIDELTPRRRSSFLHYGPLPFIT